MLVVLTMSLLNFLSRLTYKNILSPMILKIIGNNSMTLGIVNAAMGAGGIAYNFFRDWAYLPETII